MIKGGPKITNDGLVLCLDAHDRKSFLGDITTNLCATQGNGGSNTVAAGWYTWVNSGAWSPTTYSEGVNSPVGTPPIDMTGVGVLKGTCTSTGSIHFGIGAVSSISASTQYTYSVWFYQEGRSGIGGPYARANVSNSNLGTLKYNGTTGSSNWPKDKWILLEVTFTTQSSDTLVYISNYFGSQVGDTMYLAAPQLEQTSYNTPFRNGTRSYSAIWYNRVDGDAAAFYNEARVRSSHHRESSVIMPTDVSVDFDGSNDMVTFYNNTGLFRYTPSGSTYNNTISIEVWFKIDSNDGGNIISYPWNGNGEYNWRLTESFVNFSGAGGVNISGVNDGNWHQLVATATSTTVKAYIDGSLSGTTNHTSTYTGPTHGVTQHNFAIMTLYPYGTWAAGNTGFSTKGQFAIARIYNKELTAAEISLNYNATRGRFS